MIQFQWPIRRLNKKQNVPITDQPGWLPFNSGGNFTSVATLPTVNRCLRIYCDLLNNTKIKSSENFLRVLKMPNNIDSKQTFFEKLVFNYFIYGNFYAKIESDNRGQIKGLFPYLYYQIRPYPVKGNYSDSMSLQKYGYYLKYSEGNRFLPYEIMHLRDTLFTSYDFLNAPSRLALFSLVFGAGRDVLSVQSSLSKSGLKSASLLSYPDGNDNESMNEVKKIVSEFFSGPQSQRAGNILSLPEGFKLDNLNIENPTKALEFLSSVSDLQVCRLMNVPIELVSRADAQVQNSAQTLRESFRIFLKTS